VAVSTSCQEIEKRKMRIHINRVNIVEAAGSPFSGGYS
jgi:hypothetical protein